MAEVILERAMCLSRKSRKAGREAKDVMMVVWCPFLSAFLNSVTAKLYPRLTAQLARSKRLAVARRRRAESWVSGNHYAQSRKVFSGESRGDIGCQRHLI